MEQEQLDAIRERCDAATPGPWKHCGASDGKCDCHLIWSTSQDTLVAKACGPRFTEDAPYPTEEQAVINGHFIAHAREDIPALLAEIGRLRALLGMI